MSFLTERDVLIVEDSNVSRHILQKLIQDAGGHTHVYTSLANSAEILQSSYDYAILDLQVGSETSFDLIKILKERQPNVKVIVTTALVSMLEERFDIAELVEEVIEKPFSEDRVLQVLKDHRYLPLEGHRVAIVEDARVSIHAMSRIITKLGGEVDVYSDLNNMSGLLNGKYSIAFLDLLVGKGDTLHLISELKDKNPRIQIFVITAMPGLLHDHTEVLRKVSFIFHKPISDRNLERNILALVEGGWHDTDQRAELRKSAPAQCWVAGINKVLNKPDLFESPALLDISQKGLSFASFSEYFRDDEVIVWILSPGNQILELRGVIRWVKSDDTGSHVLHRYGVELYTDNSPDYSEFRKMAASAEL